MNDKLIKLYGDYSEYSYEPGDVIRRARELRHLKQKELATIAGLQQADLSKYENGVCLPSLKLLQRIADSLHMRLVIEFVPKNNQNVV